MRLDLYTLGFFIALFPTSKVPYYWYYIDVFVPRSQSWALGIGMSLHSRSITAHALNHV